MISAWPTSSTRPRTPPYSSEMSDESSRTGQSWACCQSRFGTQSTSASSPPSHGHQVRSAGRVSRTSGHADEQAEQAEHHGVLVVEADPRDRAGEQPQPRPVVEQRLGDDHDDRRPGERVERRGREPVTDRHRVRRRRDRHRGQHLRGARTAEQPRELRRQGDQRRRPPGCSGCAAPPGSPARRRAAAAASSGVNVGWSAYPHARCWPADAKYSSSRCGPYWFAISSSSDRLHARPRRRPRGWRTAGGSPSQCDVSRPVGNGSSSDGPSLRPSPSRR